jgi:hypothetical protein
MDIAVIGTGNVGSTLAAKWAEKGHTIRLGVRDTADFKGKHLLENPGIRAYPIAEAVRHADVVLLATPAVAAIEVTKALGDTAGKVIIDAMNIVRGNGPQGYSTTAQAILDHSTTEDVVKCFNTTGFNNMKDPRYGDERLDLFMCGDSERGKAICEELAKDAGFAECYDVGGNDKFELMEQFAFFWINLAMMRGYGREIGFKLLKRKVQ